MKILLMLNDDNSLDLDVSNDLPLENLKALIEAETGIPCDQMILIHKMLPLDDNGRGLDELGVCDGDIIIVNSTAAAGDATSAGIIPHPAQSQSSAIPQIDWSSVVIPSSIASSVSGGGGTTTTTPSTAQPPPPMLQSQASEPSSLPFDPETLVQHLLTNPEELAALQQRNPEMAEAILSGNPELITANIQAYRQQLMEEQAERRQLEGLDPWSEEYQERLADNIRQRNIRDNMETALEYNPEIFAGRVDMLYLECKVNGVSVKALVDTGAQMTIMNVQCAKRCNVMRLVDRRFASYAFGVGRQRIIGVIHLGQVQIGGDYLASSFRVLEDQSHDIILGLDMLKRHQCIIDLARNVLRVGTTGNETAFLEPQDAPDTSAIHRQEAQGMIADEDREMATAMARSEQEEQVRLDQQQRATDQGVEEHKIQEIMTAGFTREQAIQELISKNGDVRLALGSLLAKSLRF